MKKKLRPEGKRKKRRTDKSPMIKKLKFIMDKRQKFDSRVNFAKMSNTYKCSMGSLSNWSRKDHGSIKELPQPEEPKKEKPTDFLWKKTSLRTAPNNQMNGFATSISFNKVHEKRKLLMGKQDSVGPVTANTEAIH